jgi:hypothetical protein
VCCIPLQPACYGVQVYPIERGSCGTWMQPYAQLHRDILQGRRPPRYSIFRQDKNGLTDRLVSSVSVFLHALLTERSFLFDWSGQHNLWDAYRSSFIDWQYDKGNPSERGLPAGQVCCLTSWVLTGRATTGAQSMPCTTVGSETRSWRMWAATPRP